MSGKFRVVLIAMVGAALFRLLCLAYHLADFEPVLHTNTSSPNNIIPNTLLFNHRINLLETCRTAAMCNAEDHAATENLRSIIFMHPGARVVFYDDSACEAALRRVRPQLAVHFASEHDGRFKSDMCRLAMLSEFGGYYFDCDLSVLADARTIVHPDAKFATVLAYHGSNGDGSVGFFQAFVASDRAHPLLAATLSLHERWYAADREHGDAFTMSVTGNIAGAHSLAAYNLGTVLLRYAFEEWAGPGALDETSRRGFHPQHGTISS